MKLDIIKKLDSVINSGNFTEPNVLYIFVELRKFYENSGNLNYGLLIFISNWVAHNKLDRKDAVKILKELEKNIKPNGFAQNNFGFISFIDLKNEIIMCFRENNLNHKMITDNWSDFLDSLIRIISDCPLENKKGKIITKFTIIKNNNNKVEYEAEVVKGSIANNPLTSITKIRGSII